LEVLSRLGGANATAEVLHELTGTVRCDRLREGHDDFPAPVVGAVRAEGGCTKLCASKREHSRADDRQKLHEKSIHVEHSKQRTLVAKNGKPECSFAG
jgi:hypothetical protein